MPIVPDIPEVLPLDDPPRGRDRWLAMPGVLNAYDRKGTVFILDRPGVAHVRVSSETWQFLQRFQEVYEEAGVYPQDLPEWPETPLQHSYLVIFPGPESVRPVAWFFTEDQRDGIRGMLYDGSKIVWSSGACSRLVLGVGPRGPHRKIQFVDLTTDQMEAMVEAIRAQRKGGPE